jgi:glycosyltransferase involved in cell wall biosynthesis
MDNKVSIITITQLSRYESLKLLYELILNQTFKDIVEWIIVEGSPTLEEANCNKVLINELALNSKINIKYIEQDNINNKIGYLRNKGNKLATGDIIIKMDDDDYYFPSYINYCVDKLTKSDKLVAGTSVIYIHDIMIGKTFKSKLGTNIFAYKKEFLKEHSYDENSENNEDDTLIKNIDVNDIVPLLSEHLLVKLIHTTNNSFKKILTLGATITKFNELDKLEDKSINFVLPTNYYEQYKKIFVLESEVEHDIVYFAGGIGVYWEPSDTNLGGSEQAIVNISENWVKLGKKVMVYGNFKSTQIFNRNGVDYCNWIKFPFEKKFKTLIAWRKHGIIFFMNIKLKADKLVVDLHDNLSYTLSDLDPVLLSNFFNTVNKFNVKSQYHKQCLKEFTQSHFKEVITYKPIPDEKIIVIPNGVRVEKFINNTILNNNELIKRQPYRFCYCSSYDRGLETILTKIWPIIYRAQPLAELHVYYGMDYIYDEHFKIRMTLLLGQPGVMDHGRQSMDMIIREKYLSTFHLYLSDSIAEIDCISIKESLITGCIPIISKTGVFNERHGLQFTWNPQDDKICESIANEIINKMNSPDFIEDAQEMLKKSNTIITWEEVAKLWLAKLVI